MPPTGFAISFKRLERHAAPRCRGMHAGCSSSRCQSGSRPASADAGVVGLGGFEPPPSRLSVVRSSQLSYRPAFQPSGWGLRAVGGASRTRTGDPVLAKHVLSRLSYGPNAATHAPSTFAGSRRAARRTAYGTISREGICGRPGRVLFQEDPERSGLRWRVPSLERR